MTVNYGMIGRQIQERRRARQITQAELAELIEMSACYVSCIERAKKQASLESLIRIANALDTTVDYLLSGNQRNDSAVLTAKWTELLSDCSNKEKAIIFETAYHLKSCLRRNASDT